MTLLVIALAPVFIIAGYIYFRDKYEKEPIYLLLLSLLAGAIITIPIAVCEGILSGYSENFAGLWKPAWHGFVVAGFTEEFFKYSAMFILIWRRREFNEKFDGIVYAVFISLGFASVENILYVAEGGNVTGLIRAFTAVPAHAIFGVTMGFFFGYAKFNKKGILFWKIKALVYPILLHGIYDFILMSGIEWLSVVFIGFLVFLFFSAMKKIKDLSKESIFRTSFILPEPKFEKHDNNDPTI